MNGVLCRVLISVRVAVVMVSSLYLPVLVVGDSHSGLCGGEGVPLFGGEPVTVVSYCAVTECGVAGGAEECTLIVLAVGFPCFLVAGVAGAAVCDRERRKCWGVFCWCRVGYRHDEGIGVLRYQSVAGVDGWRSDSAMMMRVILMTGVGS